MLTLRNFNNTDALLLSSKMNIEPEQAEVLINDWNSKQFNGTFFEMYAIVVDEVLVGMISLYEHSKSIISIGPEVFAEYRQKGFAKLAMIEAIRLAEGKGFRIVLQQVRTDNIASIRLHESLDFEKDNNTYKNRKGNDVYLFIKCI